MRRRAFLATVAIALSGCSTSSGEPSESTPASRRSVGEATVEVTDWVDDSTAYGPYSATYVEASGGAPIAGYFSATFDDGSQARGTIPGDPHNYGERGEDRYHSPGAAPPGEEREELSGWVFYHPDSAARIESVTLDTIGAEPVTWERS